MKKFKYLLANGCSFTLGSCMYEEEWEYRQNLNRFSKKLADKLNLEEINISTGGSSNDRIFRTTFDWIENNKEKVKDKEVTEKELISYCKETLAGFKVPKKIEFCELPKTSTGKIQKLALREQFKDYKF